MLRNAGTWDVRLPPGLARLFPRARRRGYYYKVSRAQARRIVALLARAYGVAPPLIDETTPRGFNGWYRPGIHTISMWPRAHMKTVFHEFYHHLDHVTSGKYDSSDHPGRWRLTPRTERTGPVSLAWKFADRLFDMLRRAP